jgi:type IV secretory pathway VirB4 component
MRRHAEQPGHRATTAVAQAIYPFVAEGGLSRRGVYIGRDLYGGSFVFDPFVLYEARLCTNPNMLVIGDVGSGKSSLIKTYLFRQSLFGRCIWVADPKGEYAPLAAAIDGVDLALAPGGDVRVNPLASGLSEETRLLLLRAITITALGRSLLPEEDAALRESLRDLDQDAASTATLATVVARLLRPSPTMAERLATHPERLGEATRSAALALQRLIEGDLHGMLDGAELYADFDLNSDAVVLDLSAFYESTALGVVMGCAAAWQRAAVDRRHADADREGRRSPKFISVFDEAWRVLAIPGIAEWLQDSFKRARSYGVQNIVVMHRLSDLAAVGATGSREVAPGRRVAP